MTAVLPGRPDVVESSVEDLRETVRRALERSGTTFDELEAQARTGRFANLQGRLAWMAIRDLRSFAP